MLEQPLADSVEATLDELVQRWQDFQEAGMDISAAELCADRPELVTELGRCLDILREMGKMLQRIREVEATTIDAGPLRAQGDELMPPKLKGFEFKRLLGRGGGGEVWLATDLNLNVERAIKVLASDRYTEANVARLIEEGRVMGQLPRHPNRVQVHGLIPGVTNCFLIMEYVEGGALSAQTTPARPLDWQRALRYTADVADALADLHAAGILHRDIKPANILWERTADRALLADYGIAAYLHVEGTIAGTRGYLAPELRNGPPTPAADVFALAATLYHLVTGSAPFRHEDVMVCLEKARVGLTRPVAALRRVPAVVEEVILAGLEPDPARRLDLESFRARLRGAHLQSLADRLLELSRRSRCPVHLSVAVATATDPELVFRPVPCAVQAPGVLRDLEFVPESPPQAEVHTGGLLRLEVQADADGHVTILNLSSSGDLKVIFPNPIARDNRVRAGVWQRVTVKVTPPAGIDRAAVIWTREATGLSPAEWRDRFEAGQLVAEAGGRALRGLDFVLHEAEVLPDEEWTAQVVSISHQAGAK